MAWIFAGRSITRRYVTLLIVDNETQPCATMLLETETGGRSVIAERDVTDDSQAHTTEPRPGVDATMLGRLLVALGAPQGTKYADRRNLRLPAYLNVASRESCVWTVPGLTSGCVSLFVAISPSGGSRFRATARLRSGERSTSSSRS